MNAEFMGSSDISLLNNSLNKYSLIVTFEYVRKGWCIYDFKYRSIVMEYKQKPLYLAITSIAFPLITLIIVNYIFLTLQETGLGGVGLLPFALVAFILASVGNVLGVMRGMAALRLGKELPFQEKQRISIYACLGIVLSFAEFGYLAYKLGIFG